MCDEKSVRDVRDVVKDIDECFLRLKEKYKSSLTELLEERGYDKDVRQKRTGYIGRMNVCSDIYSELGYRIKFFRYTKAGTLSKKCEDYVYSLDDYEIVN